MNEVLFNTGSRNYTQDTTVSYNNQSVVFILEKQIQQSNIQTFIVFNKTHKLLTQTFELKLHKNTILPSFYTSRKVKASKLKYYSSPW